MNTENEERRTVGAALSKRDDGVNQFAFQPQNFTELQAFCALIANSDLAPKDYKGKPGNVLVAVQMGAEVGLKPMQAIQNIAIINGRPSVWGDAALALVRTAPAFEGIDEYFQGKDDELTAICEVKRRNNTPVVRMFSVADAKKANLWNKDGPWKTYPNRMLAMRARGFAIRDAFPDALKGLSVAEEALDYPVEQAAHEQATAPATRTDALREKLTQQVVPAQPVEERAFPRTGNGTKAITDAEYDALEAYAQACSCPPADFQKIIASFGGRAAVLPRQLDGIRHAILSCGQTPAASEADDGQQTLLPAEGAK